MAIATTTKFHKCHCCGKKIDGLEYPIEGKKFCYDCYQKILQERETIEQTKQHLYDYIKKTFAINEIPSEIICALERELNNGKKVKGIEMTLRYCYDIMGNTPNLNYLILNIRDYYESAKQYVIKTKKLKEYNATVELNAPPVNIKLSRKDLDTNRTKFDYNIEDL